MSTADNSSLTVRLDGDLRAKLEALARNTKRSKSRLAAEAIAAYVELNQRQVAEIAAGIAELDSGEVVAESEAEGRYERLLRKG